MATPNMDPTVTAHAATRKRAPSAKAFNGAQRRNPKTHGAAGAGRDEKDKNK